MRLRSGSIEGRVAFEEVTFRYFGGGEPVLADVDFDIQPGQTVALLGATGSGKSTIINLIPRFYDPSAGQVLIDGQDVREVQLESLRSQIGIVLQDTTLFSGTIRDNIAFGRPEASLEDVIEAAKAAAAHDFILSFPEGYDTPGRRTRHDGQRRAEAAHRHRPRPADGPAHPDPGRLDQQCGRGDRGGDPEGAGAADAGADELRHRPAHQHRPYRRPGPGARSAAGSPPAAPTTS